uniref:Uncharacterized protein n=1 Tax=Arundo donax TaxID=35708 RepID=A0A0A9GDP6_ARUDO
MFSSCWCRMWLLYSCDDLCFKFKASHFFTSGSFRTVFTFLS